MIEGIFNNATTLIAFVAVTSQLFRNKPVTLHAPLWLRVLNGLLWGAMGIILIYTGVKVAPRVILDFRNLAVILAAMAGGFVSALVSAFVMGAYRLLYAGISPQSLSGTVSILCVGLACGLLAGRRDSRTLMVASALVMGTVGFYVSVGDIRRLLGFVPYYWLGTVCMGYFSIIYFDFVSSIYDHYRRLKEESSMDFLTGLPNVRGFDGAFNAAVARAVERREQLSMLVVDIDLFKSVNDTYGHEEGDAVLRSVAQTMKGACREFDVTGRIGGEEFAVLLIDSTTAKASAVAERIRRAVEESRIFLSTGQGLQVTVSIGVSTYPDISPSPGTLKADADSALYAAKRSGRNRVVIHEHNG